MNIEKWNEITSGPLSEFDEAGRHFVCDDLALSRYGVKYTTLRKHCRLGSPLLPDNRKPRKPTVSITSKNGTRSREYFDEADLIAMKAPRAYPAGYINGGSVVLRILEITPTEGNEVNPDLVDKMELARAVLPIDPAAV